MDYATAQLATLVEPLRYITMDGIAVWADAGEQVWVAYDPRYDEYTATIQGLNFDILCHEFSYLTI